MTCRKRQCSPDSNHRQPRARQMRSAGNWTRVSHARVMRSTSLLVATLARLRKYFQGPVSTKMTGNGLWKCTVANRWLSHVTSPFKPSHFPYHSTYMHDAVYTDPQLVVVRKGLVLSFRQIVLILWRINSEDLLHKCNKTLEVVRYNVISALLWFGRSSHSRAEMILHNLNCIYARSR